MRSRIVRIICTLVVAGSVVVLGGGPTSAGDPPKGGPLQVGRYQTLVDKNGIPSYLFDTATGQVWDRRVGEKIEWTEQIPPSKGRVPAQVGRYRVLVDKNGLPNYLFDTATGQIWDRRVGEKTEWVEHIAPPRKK
jgi:hypothetical protein